MEMALKFFKCAEGVIEPGAQFPKKRAWPFLSGVHHRVESKEFNWPILGQMAIFI